MNITLFDTAAATDNLGDEIIMQAIEAEVRYLFPDAYIYKVATHEFMTRASRQLVRRSDLAIVCGTNLLSPHFLWPKWKLRPWDIFSLNHAVLLGVGWCNYRRRPDVYTRWYLHRILKIDAIHSVRSAYTANRLSGLRRRVSNTACPTMWRLTPSHCAAIPRRRQRTVVTTLNSWHCNPESDRAWLEALLTHYGHVFFWPQSSEDRDYFSALNINGIRCIPPSLAAYDRFLENEAVDYAGLRLHGGIRALQKFKRTLIVAVDNRAAEIGRDTGLPVIMRNDLDALTHWVAQDSTTSIQLPVEAITEWRQQFFNSLPAAESRLNAEPSKKHAPPVGQNHFA